MAETVSAQDILKLAMAGIGQPRNLTLNLANAFTDQKFTISGTQFGVWTSAASTDEIQVRFNESRAPQIPFSRGQILAVPFTEVHITVPADLTGNMVILYGHGSMDLFRIFPSIAGSDALLQLIVDELRGDVIDEDFGIQAVGLAAVNVIPANADRKACSVQARWDNGGVVYIGYDNTVGPANYQGCLSAGDGYTWDDYRGDVYAEASIAAQELGWGEW